MGLNLASQGGGWSIRPLRPPGVGPALLRAWPWLLCACVASAAAAAAWAYRTPHLGELRLGLSGALFWAAVSGIGGFCGLVLSAAMVALAAPKRVTAEVAQRYADKFDGAVLAMTPGLIARDLRQVAPDLRDPAGLVVSAPQSLFAQCARSVALRICRWRAGEAGMTVSFIAASPREGASAMALSVGRSLALAGRKVALIDTDVRERTASGALGLTEGRGLWTALDAVSSGAEVSVEAHLAPDTYTTLMVLPQADGWAATREVYAHPYFVPMLDAMKQQFEYVLLDCGPVGLNDGRRTAVHADAIIIVTRWNGTLARHLSVAQRGLQQLGGVLPGLVVNGAMENAVRRWLSKL